MKSKNLEISEVYNKKKVIKTSRGQKGYSSSSRGRTSSSAEPVATSLGRTLKIQRNRDKNYIALNKASISGNKHRIDMKHFSPPKREFLRKGTGKGGGKVDSKDYIYLKTGGYKAEGNTSSEEMADDRDFYDDNRGRKKWAKVYSSKQEDDWEEESEEEVKKKKKSDRKGKKSKRQLESLNDVIQPIQFTELQALLNN